MIFSPKCECPLFVTGAICARNFKRGDFLHPVAWDHLFPKRTILPENNVYCGEVICQLVVFPCFLICLLLFIYIFIQLVLFCLHVGSFSFPFSDVFQSGKRCEFFAAFPNHLQPWVSRVQETVLASKAETGIRTYLADFKHWKLWALSNGFCYMPANTFPVAGYLQCLILKQILLLLHLMLFTVSTEFNAWPVCRGFLILSFLLRIVKDRPIS